MKVVVVLVLGALLVPAAFVAALGATLAEYPWMAGTSAVQSQGWAPRPIGPVSLGGGGAGVPADQWAQMLGTAHASDCGVSAADLAAIAQTESGFGANTSTNASGHSGYGQFDAATWAAYGSGDPNNPADALAAIARVLCGRGYRTNRTAALNSYGGCTTAQCIVHPGVLPAYVGDYAGLITQLARGYQVPTDVVTIAQTWLLPLVPYQFGGCTRQGVDCSCLMVQIFAAVGVQLPRIAADQYAATQRITAEEAQPGDLVFFANTYQPGISHVGLYIGNGQQINAPTEHQYVSVQPVFTGYWGQHLAGFGRVRR